MVWKVRTHSRFSLRVRINCNRGRRRCLAHRYCAGTSAARRTGPADRADMAADRTPIGADDPHYFSHRSHRCRSARAQRVARASHKLCQPPRSECHRITQWISAEWSSGRSDPGRAGIARSSAYRHRCRVRAKGDAAARGDCKHHCVIDRRAGLDPRLLRSTYPPPLDRRFGPLSANR